jgi:hypothetical protein
MHYVYPLQNKNGCRELIDHKIEPRPDLHHTIFLLPNTQNKNSTRKI